VPWSGLSGSIPGTGPVVTMPRTTDAADSGTDSAQLADHLDMDIGQDDLPTEDLGTLVDALGEEVSPLVETLLQGLVATVEDLQARLDELETQQADTHEIATTAVGDAAATEARLDDLEDDHEKTRDIARSAVAKAEQVESQATADPDQEQEDAEHLPTGVEPSSSPLDFFANCRATKIQALFVEDSNRTNTYRAITVAKRWKEFATERTDGSGVFFTKDDLTTALTAHLGEKPHRQTVKRVWDTLRELGGDDLRAKTRQVGRRQEPVEILTLDRDTAEGLLEKRYVGLDLLEGTGGKAQTGGVTPVVTGAAD